MELRGDRTVLLVSDESLNAREEQLRFNERLASGDCEEWLNDVQKLTAVSSVVGKLSEHEVALMKTALMYRGTILTKTFSEASNQWYEGRSASPEYMVLAGIINEKVGPALEDLFSQVTPILEGLYNKIEESNA